MGALKKDIPLYINSNLNPNFEIRDYQKEAFARFSYYLNDFPNKKIPIHLLFNMATGSGKTFIMASLILELYEKGYRNFLFFVNSTNIIEKTKDNFVNNNSSKYLFNQKISFDNKQINIKEVDNFTTSHTDDINIKFTTIQGLHMDLTFPKENGLTYEDFKDNKIVILSDEAHHINSTTKKSKLNKTEELQKSSWEQTVMNILKSHKDNLLLEFTATVDLQNENIAEKYLDKIIYKYDLKQFRLDGYSKEVDILKADMEQDDRILQAIILSQYRLKVAEKNRIYCKPVILFKAQKTIAESQTNLENFNQLIKNLKVEDLEKIQNTTNEKVLLKVFNFFEENNLSLQDITNELKQDFAEENCISANDDKQAEKNQILLNTLEEKNNRIRAIFAVQKLNEGWDVLNLFDIVRLYDSRSNVIDKKTGKVKVGPQTMSEAQLIGRGARYFPFTTDKAIGESKYKRKFDKKDDEELKILETFYYHTSFDNLYITEIKQALKDTGMMDEEEKKDFTIKLKDSFKKSNFYKNGYIYTNKRKEKDNQEVSSLEEVGMKIERFEFTLHTGKSGAVQVFESSENPSGEKIEKEPKSFQIKDIDIRIIKKAIQQNDFYKFDNLKKYIGKLKSIEDFITNYRYLSSKRIDLYSSKDVLENLSNDDLLKAVSSLLKSMENEIKQQETKYEGTTMFDAKSIQEMFKEKTIKVSSYEDYTKNQDWFVFDKITATSEEKYLVELFEKKIQELNDKYEDIYLIRNERHFAIYSFEDGDRFEPDFVLFMKEKQTKKPLTYQIFIEPKGSQFKDAEGLFGNSKEAWKEKFLSGIDEKAEIIDSNFGNYKLIGLPLYNKDLESDFEEAFDDRFGK
ncbi:DEAD/DEAH box helicase family protein [Candidatus Vampirococcus lugosii]